MSTWAVSSTCEGQSAGVCQKMDVIETGVPGRMQLGGFATVGVWKGIILHLHFKANWTWDNVCFLFFVFLRVLWACRAYAP